MKLNTILGIASLCVASILASVSAQAAVTLLIDDHIKVTAVNGQEVKGGLFQPLTKELTLEPGRHVITAKYDRLYDLSRDNHDYLRSANISVAAQLEDNKTYHLTMPGQPEAYRDAKKYAEHPILAVQYKDTIIAKQESLDSSSGGFFSGISSTIGSIFGGGNKAQVANQQAISALEQSSENTTQPVSTNSTNASTLDQFMQLWLQATPDERAKIRQWVQE